MFGNARKQPADPNYTVPSGRRVIWEHGQDLALFLSISVIFNILFVAAIVGMSMVLISIYQRPPYILTEAEGFVMYRNTEVFKLRVDMIRTFLDITTTRLLNINPGGYDVSGIEALTTPAVIKYYSGLAQQEAEARAKSNLRRIWQIKEIRRYYDKKLPQYLCVAVKGEKINYEQITTASGLKDIRTTSSTSLIIVYLSQTMPSPANPWGLILEGILAVDDKDVAKAEAIWKSTTELQNGTDLAGRAILPAKTTPSKP